MSLAQLEPGQIVLTARPELATVSCDPPNGRVEAASEGAATAARRVLNTPNLGHPQLEAAVGALQFALAPFAAGYGAASASQQRLLPDELTEAKLDVEQALRANAGSEALRDKVADAGRQMTCRLLVCGRSVSEVPASQVPVSAVLELAVERLSLKVSKASTHEYVLRIEARAQLRRPKDSTVLLDRAYEYESGPSLFIDWSQQGGLNGVAQTGFQSLAKRIAEDIFKPAAEAPLLIGPGQNHSALERVKHAAHQGPPALCGLRSMWPLAREGGQGRPIPLASHRRHGTVSDTKAALLLCRAVQAEAHGLPNTVQSTNEPAALSRESREASSTNIVSAEPVHFVGGTATTIEVFSRGVDGRLGFPAPAEDAHERAESDTLWALDGLESDRNAVVQFMACIAAVPFGMWEQTVGAVQKPRREKTERLVGALEALPEQYHFAEGLADEVARSLRSQVINPVRRTDESPGFAVPMRNEMASALAGPTDSARNSPLALRLQTVNAKLTGKHRSSRSRALCVEIQATVIRTFDGQELYSRAICYRSSSKNLKDWATADAKLFREELEACSRQTAQAVSNEMLERGFVTEAVGRRQ